MGSYRSVYGEITFKSGLSATQVKKLDEITGCWFDVGETEIEFNDDWFDINDLVDWLERLRKDKVISGSIGDYGDHLVKFTYNQEKKKWYEYQREFLCDLSDDTLIDELKLRGCTLIKKE